MSTWFPEHFDYEDDYDPPVDESVTIRCVNPQCSNYYEPDANGESGETWHPRTFSEYEGVAPHGGMVDFYEGDAFACEFCGEEGEEVIAEGREP